MRFGFRLVSTTAFVLLAAITGAPMVVGAPPTPSAATQISEIPDKFVMPEAQNDYLKRERSGHRGTVTGATAIPFSGDSPPN